MDIVRKLTSSLSIPLGWTVLTIVLLCLPGSAFPGGGFFNIPHLDKVIHVILFGGVTIFWCLYFMQKRRYTKLEDDCVCDCTIYDRIGNLYGICAAEFCC